MPTKAKYEKLADCSDLNPEPYTWTPASTKKASASLLARLAEAADGIRNGRPMWFVAQLEREGKKGHKIFGPYGNSREALDKRCKELTRPEGKFMIFGPYNTVEDPEYEPQKRVKCVILVLTDKAGKEERVCLDGQTYDCVFWSLSAMDKFVFPYYAGVGSLEETLDMRDTFLDEDTYAGVHIPGSEIVTEATFAAGCTDAGCKAPANEDGVGTQALRMESGEPGGGSDPVLSPL